MQVKWSTEDEVLTPENNYLIPVKVIKVSNVAMKGDCYYLTAECNINSHLLAMFLLYCAYFNDFYILQYNRWHIRILVFLI